MEIEDIKKDDLDAEIDAEVDTEEEETTEVETEAEEEPTQRQEPPDDRAIIEKRNQDTQSAFHRASGENAELRRRLDSMERDRRDAQKREEDRKKALSDEAREVMQTPGFGEAFDSLYEQRSRDRTGRTANEIAMLKTTVANLAAGIAAGVVERKHPDWRGMVQEENKPFWDWYGGQPTKIKECYNSNNPDDLVYLFDEFKKSSEFTSMSARHEEITQKRNKQKRDAESISGGSVGIPQTLEKDVDKMSDEEIIKMNQRTRFRGA